MQHVKTIAQMFCNEREKACRMCNINLKYITNEGEKVPYEVLCQFFFIS